MKRGLKGERHQARGGDVESRRLAQVQYANLVLHSLSSKTSIQGRVGACVLCPSDNSFSMDLK
jgi:hypothetical protein